MKPLGRLEIAQVVLALQASGRFDDRSLEEIMEEACYILFSCEQYASNAETKYLARKHLENAAAEKIIPFAEAIQLITGQKRPSVALDWFARFKSALGKPVDFIEVWSHIEVNGRLKSLRRFTVTVDGVDREETGYRKSDCDLLKAVYAQWRRSETSRHQSARAQKSPKKKKAEKSS